MVSYTIDAAVGAGCLDAIVLSTEDEEIAGLGAAAGLIVRDRPAELVGDTVSAAEVALDAAAFAAARGIETDAVVYLAPVYPLVTAADIAAAWQAFADSGAQFLMSVTPVDPHDFHWALRPEGAYARPYFGAEFMRDRSELPHVYSATGAIKIAGWDALEAAGNFFGDPLLTFELPRERSLYIGEEIDFALAETLLRRRSGA